MGFWGKCHVFNDESAHRRHHSSLSLGSRVWGRCLRGSGKHAEALAGQVFTGGPGIRPFIGKGFRIGSSLTTDDSLLKGLRCSSSGSVPVLWFRGAGGEEVRLWFRYRWRSALSLLHMLQLLDLWVWACCPWKATQHLLRNRRGHLELVLRLQLRSGGDGMLQ